MRKFLAIVVCKLGRFVGKLVGKGSSMPGKFALKICPDILRRVQLPPHIIAVTGSNGKTSTVEMIATVLRGQGKNVIYNAEGSNQVEGVTTLILTHATLGGKVNADVLLLESDERYAAHSFKYFHPTEFVITNLYRDQLTRNGHPESVFDAILPAIHPDTELILNGDDPLSSCFAIGHEKVKWFGLNHCATDTEAPTGVYHDGAYCPVCHAPMEYEYVHYNHIGAYRCTSCGHARPDPDYAATELDLQNGKLILDGQFTVALAFRSIYNVYTILAAYAACRECGVEGAAIADTLSSYILKNGRMQTFTLGQHHGILLTSKHENSIAYDTNLRYIASANEDCTVLIIVDAVSRKYFTSETSWLWDIDFDQLNVPHVKRVILSGLYRNDLAERFSFTALPAEKWSVQPDIAAAAKELAELIGVPSAKRLEAFDISHISGYHSVASMVVFENGKARPNEYRKFKLRTIDGPDDYASMREVLTRRFTDERFKVYPDILMMDGCKGQVNIALEVLDELHLNIPVCGMVKDDYHRTRGLYYNNKEVEFPKNTQAFDMVTRLQDEAHRFAIEYHRSLRSKSQVHSILEDIPGIGPARRKDLMGYFKDISRIREASIEELMQAPSMNRNAAEAVYGFFHKE